MTIGDPDLADLVLRFADDEHLMGQAHTEWIGVAPFLEEDLAFASIGQDELGHAAMLYELLDEDVDALALRRDAADYRSCDLVELACDDWADALVRHWLYDAAEGLRWQAMADSSMPELGAVAQRAQREEQFHLLHADALLDALLGSAEAGDRIRAALDRLLPAAMGIFEPVAAEEQLVQRGVIHATTADLLGPWQAAVDARFGAIDWETVSPAGSRSARHPDFDPMYARMREVILIDPTATW